MLATDRIVAPDDWNEAIQLLKASKSQKRRDGAKRLRKMALPESGPYLLESLKVEIVDEHTWETQYQIIMALGESKWDVALSYLKDLCNSRFEHTMIYMALGDAIVRLSHPTFQINEVMTFLQLNNVMLFEGGLRGLAMTKSVVPPPVLQTFLEYANSLLDDEVGMWCRVWAAAVATGVDDAAVRRILSQWAGLSYSQLQRAASASMRGQYLKWSVL